jgi:ketosteroid isomerase-like protein
MPATTRSVLDHHLAAFDSGNMDVILSGYSADAVLLTPKGVFRGHKQIRPVLQRILDDIFADCTSFEMIRQIVEGDMAYIVWSAESKKVKVLLATDTFVIKGAKIVAQTYAASMEQIGPAKVQT